MKLLLHLFSRPIINVNQVKDALGVTYNTANSLVSIFQEKGILKVITGFSRNKMFALQKYLELFRK